MKLDERHDITAGRRQNIHFRSIPPTPSFESFWNAGRTAVHQPYCDFPFAYSSTEFSHISAAVTTANQMTLSSHDLDVRSHIQACD
jgi:hypothetical protein